MDVQPFLSNDFTLYVTALSKLMNYTTTRISLIVVNVSRVILEVADNPGTSSSQTAVQILIELEYTSTSLQKQFGKYKILSTTYYPGPPGESLHLLMKCIEFVQRLRYLFIFKI
jgi:hypothetical protein